MKDIIQYNDYREFLKDYFKHQKLVKIGFSHRFFAAKAGFSSSSYISKIMNGQRNLSDDSLEKLSNAIGFKKEEKTFFKNLVHFNQVETEDEKLELFNLLEAIRSKVDVHYLGSEFMHYYQNWYYPVIRNIVVYAKWDGDYAKLAKLIIPEITAEQAKEAVKDLLKLQMLAIDDKGIYYQPERLISSENIPIFMKKKARADILIKAEQALDRFKAHQRYTSCTLLATTEERYNDLVKRLDEIVLEAMTDAYNEEGADRVYEMVLQVFPFSKNFNNPIED